MKLSLCEKLVTDWRVYAASWAAKLDDRDNDDCVKLLRQCAKELSSALAQQAPPLTDAEIEEESQRWKGVRSGQLTTMQTAFSSGARWARDRMAQQAQPEMPTLDAVKTALLSVPRDPLITFGDRASAAMLALFAKETTP